MRYLGLLIFVLAIPALVGAIRANVAAKRAVLFLMGAGPFIFSWLHLNVAVISWAYWPGYVKGLIVALPDLLAIAILVTTKRRGGDWLLPLLLGFYIVCCTLSIFNADVPVASFFYVWQLVRVLLVALAVARVCAYPGSSELIVYGLCAGTIVQCFFSIEERLLSGIVQAYGTMGHQNQLGMTMHFALLAPLALILAGDRRLLLKVGAMAALLTVALTGSRATVAFALGGAVLLVAASTLQKPTVRKFKVVGLSAAIGLLATPVIYSTFADRFAVMKYEGTDGERQAFERAAKAMWSDHPFGVGANQYVSTANSRGYSERAGVSWVTGSRSANVHNVYLLIAAETGWPGLISFIALFSGILIIGIRTTCLNDRFRYSPLALGYTVVLIVIGIHSFYEWIFVTEPVQYLFAIAMGTIAGLNRQYLWLHRRERHNRRAVEITPCERSIRDPGRPQGEVAGI